MKDGYIFTSESVTEGHPDKICDQVSDAILDACLEQDKNSRVACECFASENYLLIGGEITTKAIIDPEAIARGIIKEIGYTKADCGFCYDNLKVDVRLNTQSPDIAMGVDIGGAGDQGIMFGYACNDTKEFMPAPIQYAHKLSRRLTELRKLWFPTKLMPDGKTQVSVEYDKNGNVAGIDTIVISTQHSEQASIAELQDIVKNDLIPYIIPSELIHNGTKILVNPTGRFVIGGPKGDTGLTGRKIIVDSYGGFSRHGGGCWSGKDPTKVDRSAAYMARHIAKSIVASEFAAKCEVQLAYAIGVKEPVAVYVDTFGTINPAFRDSDLVRIIKKTWDLSPEGIIDYLDLRNFSYKQVAAYGHMGRDDIACPWERVTDL